MVRALTTAAAALLGACTGGFPSPVSNLGDAGTPSYSACSVIRALNEERVQKTHASGALCTTVYLIWPDRPELAIDAPLPHPPDAGYAVTASLHAASCAVPLRLPDGGRVPAVWAVAGSGRVQTALPGDGGQLYTFDVDVVLRFDAGSSWPTEDRLEATVSSAGVCP